MNQHMEPVFPMHVLRGTRYDQPFLTHLQQHNYHARSRRLKPVDIWATPAPAPPAAPPDTHGFYIQEWEYISPEQLAADPILYERPPTPGLIPATGLRLQHALHLIIRFLRDALTISTIQLWWAAREVFAHLVVAPLERFTAWIINCNKAWIWQFLAALALARLMGWRGPDAVDEFVRQNDDPVYILVPDVRLWARTTEY